jgi:molybdate transport system substrate-binding protein
MTNTRFLPGLLALLLPMAAPAQDAGIRVLCSNGFRAAMEKLLPQVKSAIGGPVNIQFGASANFKSSIEGGESFDLLIVTPQVIGDLAKEGKIAAGTQTDLASSGVGIAVRAGRPKPDVSSAQAIKQTLLDAKSVGYVKVGAGTPAILDLLNRLGISADVERKTVFQSGAQQSMKNLAGGQIDVAIALVSEILPAPGVQFAGPFPPEFQRRIIMSAGIASSTKNRAVCQKIIKSLTNASAAAAIKSAGLDPIR